MEDDSRTTTKFRNFVNEPMGSKSVMALPGIGEKLSGKLAKAGFHQACDLFGQYLILKEDKTEFTKWIKAEFNMNTHNSDLCYECLSDWCEEFLNGERSKKMRDRTAKRQMAFPAGVNRRPRKEAGKTVASEESGEVASSSGKGTEERSTIQKQEAEYRKSKETYKRALENEKESIEQRRDQLEARVRSEIDEKKRKIEEINEEIQRIEENCKLEEASLLTSLADTEKELSALDTERGQKIEKSKRDRLEEERKGEKIPAVKG